MVGCFACNRGACRFTTPLATLSKQPKAAISRDHLMVGAGAMSRTRKKQRKTAKKKWHKYSHFGFLNESLSTSKTAKSSSRAMVIKRSYFKNCPIYNFAVASFFYGSNFLKSWSRYFSKWAHDKSMIAHCFNQIVYFFCE